MRSLIARVTFGAFLALVALWALASPAAADATTDADEAQFVTALNQLRDSKGLAALPVDSRLRDVARNWSAAMASRNQLQHNPDLAAQAPADWERLTENVGTGGDVPAIHAALVGSPGHYVNLVDANVNLVGIGVVRSGDRIWVTQVFMRAASSSIVSDPAPAPDLSGIAKSAATGAAGDGYRVVAATGAVFDYGTGSSPGAVPGDSRIVGGAPTPSRNGYWAVAENGTVHPRGDAGDFGGLGGLRLSAPIVDMAATPSGQGYWLLGRDGGVFSFGDAAFYGSTGDIRLNQPIVGIAASRSGAGYWFVASDGGIFAFGDAAFHGSAGDIRLSQPIVGMAPTGAGNGYWLVARDGGIFSFGDAGFFGSTGDIVLNQPIVGMAPSASGNGYRFVAADGGIFNFGDAGFHGSAGGLGLGRSVVAMLAG